MTKCPKCDYESIEGPTFHRNGLGCDCDWELGRMEHLSYECARCHYQQGRRPKDQDSP